MQAIGLSSWTTNAGNQQNWRFHVILNRGTIKAVISFEETWGISLLRAPSDVPLKVLICRTVDSLKQGAFVTKGHPVQRPSAANRA